MTFHRLARKLLILLALQLAPASAWAQSAEDKAGARAAAEQGARAFDAGDYAQAIDYFSRAEQLYHATPHLLYLGRARVRSGQLVQAREHFLAIINEPLPPRANQVLKDTKAMAEKELSDLEPRLPYVSVVVQGAKADGVRVWMDDKEIPGPLIGIPQPVDPGDHRFQAKAVGMESSVASVSVREGTKETVVLTLQEGGGLQPAPKQEEESGIPQPQPPQDAGPSDSGNSGLRIGAYTALGVGVVGVALGTLFLVQSGADSNEADDLVDGCPTGGNGLPACDADVQAEISDLDDSSAQKGTLAVVSYGVGGAAIATGVILLLVSGSDSSTAPASGSTRPTLTPWVGFGSVGLTGTF